MMQRNMVNISDTQENCFQGSTTAAAVPHQQRNGHAAPSILHTNANGQGLQHMDDKTRLQSELDQERAMRLQLEQHIRELNGKLHTQVLVEQSYEDLARKYTALASQVQQMAMVIERYKSILKQLEQEKRMLLAENSSLKAQENVAQDKTRLYNILMERSKKLEEENSDLVLESETHQRQYEKWIEDITDQIVQALSTQKQLQEQCLKLQERVIDLETENAEYNKSRQVSSETRLAWVAPPKHKPRNHAASPSADSVRSMPAQHHYWKQDSVSSLEVAQYTAEGEGLAVGGVPEMSTPPIWLSGGTPERVVTKETEFPANDGSPKMRHRSVERHPSSGSLDSAYHSRGFIKHNGIDVRCKRSASAEALRDMRVHPNRTEVLKLSHTVPAAMSSAAGSKSAHQLLNVQAVDVVIHRDAAHAAHMNNGDIDSQSDSFDATDIENDPFANDADDILSKHRSLIVGSTEDIFSNVPAGLTDLMRASTIAEEELRSNSATPPHISAPPPPPRPRSRSQSIEQLSPVKPLCKLTPPSADVFDAPPLPPKQYKGSRRPYKPLPAEPDDDLDTSADQTTDSESIKQEINELTSEITRMTASVDH